MEAVLLFPIAVLALTWFLFVRPQQRRMRERETMVAELQVGDRVVTAGGIHGRIVELDEAAMQLEVASGTVLTVDTRAVGQVIRDDASGSLERPRSSGASGRPVDGEASDAVTDAAPDARSAGTATGAVSSASTAGGTSIEGAPDREIDDGPGAIPGGGEPRDR